jgi:hypothetical protein
MRFFVIGNGPSLKHTPLDRIAGEKSVGLNRCHLIYPFTKWRPTHYVKTDHNPHLVSIWEEETMLQVNTVPVCYLWDKFRDGLPRNHPNYETLPRGIGDHANVTWVPRCEHHEHPYYGRSDRRALTWHLPTICTAYSGIGPAIQIAVLEGATEIYLLGCDLGYGKEKGQDHFSPEYSKDTRELGEFDTLSVIEAHKVAKTSSPVPIYNATIGGSLDVYERIELCQLLSSPKSL